VADPGIPSSQIPPGEDWLVRRVADLERAVREMRAADILGTAGLTATPNKLTVAGELDVNGPMAVTGTLSLPAGIINNDALINPVVPVGLGVSGAAFTVNATVAVKATLNLVVPAGVSSANILAVSNASVINGSATADYITVRTIINGSGGGGAVQLASPGFMCSAGSSAQRPMSGLTSGQVIPIAVQVWATSNSWGSSGANVANVDVIALFFR